MDDWIVGVDCHAGTLTAVRVDAVGRPQGERTVPNTGAGQARLQQWAAAAPGRAGLGGGGGQRPWASLERGGCSRRASRCTRCRGG